MQINIDTDSTVIKQSIIVYRLDKRIRLGMSGIILFLLNIPFLGVWYNILNTTNQFRIIAVISLSLSIIIVIRIGRVKYGICDGIMFYHGFLFRNEIKLSSNIEVYETNEIFESTITDFIGEVRGTLRRNIVFSDGKNRIALDNTESAQEFKKLIVKLLQIEPKDRYIKFMEFMNVE